MQLKKINNVANAFTSLFLYMYISMKSCLNCPKLHYICDLLNYFSILITLAHYIKISSSGHGWM